MKRGAAYIVFLAPFFFASVYAAEPADLFSRANCFNNESITYNYFDPPQFRVIFSHHFKNNVRQHYVTENPPARGTCRPGVNGLHQVNGQYCLHLETYRTRHAGVHGQFLSSEPNPDGDLNPGLLGLVGVLTPWRVDGIHTIVIPGAGYVVRNTTATGCNLHFEQFY